MATPLLGSRFILSFAFPFLFVFRFVTNKKGNTKDKMKRESKKGVAVLGFHSSPVESRDISNKNVLVSSFEVHILILCSLSLF